MEPQAKYEVLLSPHPFHFEVGTTVEKADKSADGWSEYEVTRSDESGSWGVRIERKRADND